MSNRKSWITEKERTVLNTPIMEFVERDCRSSEDGAHHRFYVLKAPDWCNIIPITEDGKVVMIRQFRIGIERHTLEIPGGIMDPSDPDPQAAAVREMTEETGYVPLPHSRCVPLAWTHPNPAIQNNRCHFFLIGPVRRDREQALDPAEMIDVVEVPLEEIPSRILGGEITHALMLNAFFLAGLTQDGGRSGLLEAMRKFTRP